MPFLFNPCRPCCGAVCCDLGDCLKVTVSEGSGCPCLDGFTFDLERVGEQLKWTGTATPPCGDDMTVTVECRDNVGEDDCAGYYLTVEWGDHGTVGPQLVDNGCECDPAVLTFTGIVFPEQGAECDGAIEMVVEGVCCGTGVDCGICDERAAEAWSLTVAGVTADGGFCPDCANINGTWILEHVSGCLWRPVDTALVCGFNVSPWRLVYDRTISPPSGWEITAGQGVLAIWKLAGGGNLDCCGPNTFEFFSSSGCNTWPATVTITPVVP